MKVTATTLAVRFFTRVILTDHLGEQLPPEETCLMIGQLEVYLGFVHLLLRFGIWELEFGGI